MNDLVKSVHSSIFVHSNISVELMGNSEFE